MADFKFSNSWSNAAAVDARFRDPTGPLDRPAPQELPAIAAEMLDQGVVEELPRAVPLHNVEGNIPVAESWGSPHASGPRKLTAAVLAEALTLRQAGWSWPRIARKLGCHRMALYHALWR